jgi:hypothetical protein
VLLYPVLKDKIGNKFPPKFPWGAAIAFTIPIMLARFFAQKTLSKGSN